jgi:GntR family transcriptional regulator
LLDDSIKGLATAGVDLLAAESLDRRRGPLYQQLADILRRQIAAGTFPIGSALPKEAEIADRFAISLITVRRGLRELQDEGLIRKRAAKPALVAASEPLMRPSIDFHSLAAIVESTRDRRLRIRSYGAERSALASAAFGLPASEPCYCLRAILHVGDKAVSQHTIYFPPSVGSRLGRSDFDDVVVFRSVQRQLGIRLSGARVTLKAEIADAELALDLGCPEGAPILIAQMLYRAEGGDIVELSIARNRADSFSVTYDAPNDLT